MPEVVKDVPNQPRQEKAKKIYNRSAKDLPQLTTGVPCFFRVSDGIKKATSNMR